MRRIFTLADLKAAAQRGDLHFRIGGPSSLLGSEVQYQNRTWRITHIGMFTVTLED